MAWYYIVLIVVGCIICMYFTGLIFYVSIAKNVDGVNLLATKDKYVETEKGELDVQTTLDRLEMFSVVVGIFFPITIIITILGYIVLGLSKLVSPITKFIINKNLKDENNIS